MANLKDIKRRIQGVKTTMQTTNAMKLVSAAKLRRAQDAIYNFRGYAEQLNNILKNLSKGVDIDSPFFEVRENKRLLLILITSNKGLAGAFNSSIISIAQKQLEENYKDLLQDKKVDVLCIGRKGYDIFKKRKDVNIIDGTYFDVFGKNILYEKVEAIGERVMQGFVAGQWDKVLLVYNAYKNPAVQYKRVEDYLPVKLETSEEEDNALGVEYIYEPNKEQIIKELIPKIIKMRLYYATLESFVSEHGARMVAMDNATSNAEELLKNLRLQYNKARQEAITKEILEIVSGANALQ